MTLNNPTGNDIGIVVVASVRRPPTITKYLDDHKLPYRVFETPDYPVPDKRDWPWDWMNKYTPGAWRCFRGHQEALKLSDKPVTLVFEDDAVPNSVPWWEITLKAAALLRYFEVVSLHGRMIPRDSQAFNYNDRMFVIPSLRREARKGEEVLARWCCGSLAYLVGEKTKRKIIDSEYDGFPMDILIADRYKFCVLEPSPFAHPNVHGSLVNTVTE